MHPSNDHGALRSRFFFVKRDKIPKIPKDEEEEEDEVKAYEIKKLDRKKKVEKAPLVPEPTKKTPTAAAVVKPVEEVRQSLLGYFRGCYQFLF